jgi:hypothetical protein
MAMLGELCLTSSSGDSIWCFCCLELTVTLEIDHQKVEYYTETVTRDKLSTLYAKNASGMDARNRSEEK